MKLFTAEWCAPCRQLKLYLEKFSHTVEIIDVDLHPEVTTAAGVRGIPCLLLGDGTVVVSVQLIKEEINRAYGKA